MRQRRATAVFWITASLVLMSSCTQRQTPEARVRAVIASAVEAAEAGNTAALRARVAERYADGYGNDRQGLERLLRLYVLSHRPLHVYTHVPDVTFPSVDRAKVVVYAAMAGERIDDRADLPRVRASLYRFELEFVSEGDWKLIASAWRPAEIVDF